jgi:hypothetical protein
VNADLLARLIAAGTPADLVGEVAMALAASATAAQAIEQRRANDRDRKARSRDITGSHVKSRASADGTGQTPFPDKESFPQTPFKENNPNPEGVCDAPTREADPIEFPISAKLSSTRLALALIVTGAAELRTRPDLEGIVAAWNAMATRAGLAQVGKLTETRRKAIRARHAEYGADAFTEAIAAVERSAWLRGDGDAGWRATFDFLLQPSSFTKLIEGSYDRAPASRVAINGNRHGSGQEGNFVNPLVRAAANREARRAGQQQ